MEEDQQNYRLCPSLYWHPDYVWSWFVYYDRISFSIPVCGVLAHNSDIMIKIIKYFNYLIRHKWFVMVECFKVGLIWRGLVHDLSKLLPDEFIPYANYFYGNKNNDISKGRDKTGYYDPTKTGDYKFDFAWLLHQKRNKHHWQWWILPEDEGGIKVLEIKHPYDLEMLCDWIGAAKAQGKHSPSDDPLKEAREWWIANNNKMRLGPGTRQWIENILIFNYPFIPYDKGKEKKIL